MRYGLRAGAMPALLMRSRASSTPRLLAPSISITSRSSPRRMLAPTASACCRSLLAFSARANTRAMLVLPTPRVPQNR